MRKQTNRNRLHFSIVQNPLLQCLKFKTRGLIALVESFQQLFFRRAVDHVVEQALGVGEQLVAAHHNHAAPRVGQRRGAIGAHLVDAAHGVEQNHHVGHVSTGVGRFAVRAVGARGAERGERAPELAKRGVEDEARVRVRGGERGPHKRHVVGVDQHAQRLGPQLVRRQLRLARRQQRRRRRRCARRRRMRRRGRQRRRRCVRLAAQRVARRACGCLFGVFSLARHTAHVKRRTCSVRQSHRASPQLLFF